EPARHARHAGQVDQHAAAPRRLVRSHQGTPELRVVVPDLVPAGPDARPQDVRDPELARGRARVASRLKGMTTLELYHHGSLVCAAKVRFTLMEKGLEWKGHYLDLLKGEHFNPQYLKLNPKAVVPTLVHDGQVLVESTVICEYLDD